MGLRCLIGHDYGRSRTTEDRDDHGDEVVVTVREFRECARCGHRKVISENKEVTAKPEGSEGAEPGGEPSVESGGPPPPEYDDVSAAEDDGVILESGSPPEGRGHGEWPAMDDDGPKESTDPRDWPEVDTTDDGGSDADPPGEWPEAEGQDEGFDAEPDDGRGVEDVDFRGGLTPESSGPSIDDPGADDDDVVEAPGDDATDPADFTRSSMDREGGTGSPRGRPEGPNDGSRGDVDSGFTSAEGGPSPAGGQRLSATDTEVVCPECGHTAPGQSTSLRPGDICPECRRGYLAERARE